ncbi:hypothetical protein POM88_016913 [Heracleum sosnowskyi]|uniref:Uncharacterized protein n=1 Tax=Heracleum sosnowskyi TaxID=360622 RepID=A0AAD8IRJ7_9APIA|nr:hypothetical protein POM88_016913 [Heracleum sosnowskyi]
MKKASLCLRKWQINLERLDRLTWQTFLQDMVRKWLLEIGGEAEESRHEKSSFGATESVATFFSHVMSAIGGNIAGPGGVVVNVYINHEKKFAFGEMGSAEEASNALALDGIIFEYFNN